MTSLELLAPARTADIGIAAIRCGADAVYIGGPAFGARAAAGNSIDEIRRLCDYAAPFGARIYVTVNTLARDNCERRKVLDLMLAMRGCGVSAFILQDTSLLPELAAYGPWKEEIHASTQCTITSVERVVELAGMGFSRLILERQLSLAQIREIRAAVPPEVELEFFVHGALCVCYSGACYLSEALTGRSANRGECAQPCRSRYDLVTLSQPQSPESKIAGSQTLLVNQPLLSLKDLKLIDRLGELADAGIMSFKIEGRLKNDSYVKNVVRAYSLAFDALVATGPGKWRRASLGRCTGGFMPNLDKTFNRGYTDLFIDGRKGQWNSGDATKGVGEYLGRWKRPVNRSSLCGILKGDLHNGDGLCFASGNGEIVGFRIDRVEPLDGDKKLVFCKDVTGLKDGTAIWRNRDNAFERELENNMPVRSVSVDIDATASYGEPDSAICTLRVSAVREDGMKATVEIAEGWPAAENTERMKTLIANQLSKHAGIYDFRVRSLSTDGLVPLISAAQLNGIRRTLADKLAAMPVAAGNAAFDSERASVNPVCTAGDESADRPLMRSKYCILQEMGLCKKTPEGKKMAGKQLALRNNGRVIPLQFDCTGCEMLLLKVL